LTRKIWKVRATRAPAARSVAPVLATALTFILDGIAARPVRVEVDVDRGLPGFAIVGLPDAAVREARERVRAALGNCGWEFPLQRIVVNLAPASVRKAGPGMDLAIAAALLLASGLGVWFARTTTVSREPALSPADFVAIPGAAIMPPIESGSIVRVAVPVAALPSYGIAIVPELIDGTVEADFLIAQDGQARAIRLVNETYPSRSTP